MKKSIFTAIVSLTLVLLLLCSCAASIPDAEKQAIIDEAIAIQTDGGTYQADEYSVIQLKKGDKIYGMMPGQSAFYTDKATVDKAEGSYVKLYEMLQISPHPEFGYRTQIATYEVLKDMWVATGKCLANSEVSGKPTGAGGGEQFVVPDYETSLKNIETVDMHE